MLLKITNPIYTNATVLTPFGRVSFEEGYTEVSDKNKIKILLRKSYIAEAVGEVEKPKPVASEKPKYKEKIPASWTVAKMAEYADSMGVTIPEELDTKADMITFLESLAQG